MSDTKPGGDTKPPVTPPEPPPPPAPPEPEPVAVSHPVLDDFRAIVRKMEAGEFDPVDLQTAVGHAWPQVVAGARAMGHDGYEAVMRHMGLRSEA